jgi:hypothetical protein
MYTIYKIHNVSIYKIGNRDQAITLNIEGTLVSNRQDIADEFNKYFLSIAKNIIKGQNDTVFHKRDDNTPLHYLLQSFTTPFQNMNLKFVSSKEVQKI